MFGKLTFGILRTATENLPSEEAYIAAGYKRVVFAQQPTAETGYQYVPGWEDDGVNINQTWTLEQLPEEATDSEALEILLGGAVE